MLRDNVYSYSHDIFYHVPQTYRVHLDLFSAFSGGGGGGRTFPSFHVFACWPWYFNSRRNSAICVHSVIAEDLERESSGVLFKKYEFLNVSSILVIAILELGSDIGLGIVVLHNICHNFLTSTSSHSQT